MTKTNKTINVENINNIGTYLYKNKNEYFIKNFYFKDRIAIYNWSFPSSWTSDENMKVSLKRNKLKSLLELVNNFYKNANIKLLTKEDLYSDPDVERYYYQINITLAPIGRFKDFLRLHTHTFYFMYKTTDELGFRIMYSGLVFDEYAGLNNSKLFEYLNPDSEQKYLVDALEVAIEAICDEFKIVTKINKGIFLERETPNYKKDFTKLLKLLTRGGIKPKDYKLILDQLTQIQIDPENFIADLNKNEEDDEYEWCFDPANRSEINQSFLYSFLDENNMIGNSDWKFDPEDLEMFLNDLSGGKITLKVPKETYSANLFPYAKTELDKLDLELINLNSNGDNYGFIVVNKSDTNQIILLSNKYEIPLERLY